VTKSVRKTEYYKKLQRWNKRLGTVINDYIDVEIVEIKDMFIELYFDLQDNLDETLSTVETFDIYNMFHIMSVINEYFYPDDDNPPFPFGVDVYLIKIGHKDKFLKDIYYLSLLYETPKVFEIFHNRCIGNNNLIFMENDVLKVNYNTYKKYRVYPLRNNEDRNGGDYNISNIEEYQKIIDLIEPYNKSKLSNTFSECQFKIMMNYVYKILDIKDTIIHGEFVNSLIHGKNGSFDSAYVNHHIKISFCELNFISKVEEVLHIIYDDNLNVEVKHSKENIYISFDTSEYMFGKKSHIDNFIISKHVYQNINDVLESSDIDSQSCGIYKLNGEYKIVYTERYKFAIENCLCVVNPNHLLGEIKDDDQFNIYNDSLIRNTWKGYDLFIPGAIHLIGNYILPTYDEIVGDTLKNLLYDIYIEDYMPALDPPLKTIFRSSYNILDKLSWITGDIPTNISIFENYMCDEAKRLKSKFDIMKLRRTFKDNGEDGNSVSYREDTNLYTYFRDIKHLKDVLRNTFEGEYRVRYYANVSYDRRTCDYLSPF